MQIFLSYSENDIEFATSIADQLKKNGAFLWFDRNDAPMDDQEAWHEAVRNAGRSSDILLLIASAEALEQDYIREDWQYYISEGRPIIIVQTDNSQLPPTLQQRSPIRFHGIDDHSAFNRLQLALLEQASRLSTDKWRRPSSHDDD